MRFFCDSSDAQGNAINGSLRENTFEGGMYMSNVSVLAKK